MLHECISWWSAQSGSFWCNYHPSTPSKPCPAPWWLLPGIFPDLQMKRHVRCIHRYFLSKQLSKRSAFQISPPVCLFQMVTSLYEAKAWGLTKSHLNENVHRSLKLKIVIPVQISAKFPVKRDVHPSCCMWWLMAISWVCVVIQYNC